MKFDELVQDIETLLASGSPMSKSDGTSSVELEQIPQQVLFEIGRASLEIGQLRQLKTGGRFACRWMFCARGDDKSK